MGFFSFFIYACYDWLDTFNLAPNCMKRCKRIHEARDEGCEQINPVLMLKRIKHLEDVCKVLINENRDMCLYLTEPMTFDQAKKMRNNLMYYD